MYRFGENPIKRHHRHMIMVAVVLLVLIAAGIWLKHVLHGTTSLHNPTVAITHTVAGTKVETKQFSESIFTIDLPSDWKPLDQQNPAGTYMFAGSSGDGAHEALEIYIDNIPATLGVNRAVLVQANGNELSVASDVSDNCATFTSATAGAPSISSPAKWQNQPFLCDLGNYERDVVGTVSTDGINKVVMVGPASGQHNLFFTYTDANIQPDFSTFLNALQSFELK